MSDSRAFSGAPVFIALAAVLTVFSASPENAAGATPPVKVKFAAVQKVFNSNCIGCHGAKMKAGIDLRTYASVMKGGRRGPIVKPKDAAGSVIVQAVKGIKGMDVMPPTKPLDAASIKTIETWIAQGAKS